MLDEEDKRVRQTELAALCSELFDADELRRWSQRNLPPEFVQKFPHRTVSYEELLDAFVQLVERLGYWSEVYSRLSQLRETHRSAGGSSNKSAARGPSAWERRYRIARTVTAALALIYAATRGYPTLDISRAPRRVEGGVFAFLPISYRDRGLLTLIFLTCLAAVICWYAARRTRSEF